MFLLGLLVGPVVGVVTGDYLFGNRGPGIWLAIGAVLLIALVMLVLPVFDPELRLGLVLGLVLGELLALSPTEMFSSEHSVQS